MHEIYFKWQSEGTDGKNFSEPELYRSVGVYDIDGIEANNFSLVPSRYIKFEDRDNGIDYEEVLSDTAKTVSELLKRQKENDTTLRNAFKLLGYECE